MATKNQEEILTELDSHYQAWTNDNEKRMSRKNGWNDITDAYYGKLPDDWPFTSKTVDPCIRTTIVEKNARLVNGKLRGRLIPRENGDIISAQINNAILDYQWDNANEGGSMITKIGVCDLDTRLYGSKFALVKWKYEEDDNGNVIFDGNEVYPLDIRDCGMDFGASHVRDAKWFQVRTWEYLEDLENQSDVSGVSIFKGLGEIKRQINERQNRQSSQRKNAYTSRIKQLKGLEDRVGTDVAFPVIEVVTEYRRDRWITFAPEYNIILRDIPNPYRHGKIPIAQNRYYALQDDPLGESEVESVLPIWKAIQACLCGYMDESIMKGRPALKIIEGAVRIETIEYGPEAQWIVTRPDAITEMQSNGESIRYFQTSYSALKSAFNTAMGDMSQGVSSADTFNPKKTATEIKASMKQQNARDQKNQSDLAEFIKEIMLMWLSNNRQFMFTPEKKEYVIKIIGQDKFNYFKRAGLNEMVVEPEAMSAIGDVIAQKPDLTDGQIMGLLEAAQTPKYPVYDNPDEQDPEKINFKPKMTISETGDTAEVSVVPQDLEGIYDYIADVKSMSAGAGEELMQGREKAIGLLTSNPVVLQLLQLDGFRPKVKELLTADLEDWGLNDAERFFEKIENGQNNPTQTGPQETGGVPTNSGVGGLPSLPQAGVGGPVPEQMAGPSPVPNA